MNSLSYSKSAVFLWALLALLFGSVCQSSAIAHQVITTRDKASGGQPPPLGPDWKLVWHDEFNYKGHPNPKKWNFDLGYKFTHGSHVHYYTDKLDNARVEDGNLIIEARNVSQTRVNPEFRANARGGPHSWKHIPYTSARLTTLSKADWLYGRIEVRAELPQGAGMHPAIWLMGANHYKVGWPLCGEIEMMETAGTARNRGQPKRVHAGVHWAKQRGKKYLKSFSRASPTQRGSISGFHVYTMVWTPKKIEFYFDQKKYYTFVLDKAGKGKDNPFRKPQYLLLNLALGGNMAGLMQKSILPQTLRVDYVRVYQMQGM